MNEPLDFFLLLTCLPSMLQKGGNEQIRPVNTFLEAFSQYRRVLGFPASVINAESIDGSSTVNNESTTLKLIDLMLSDSKNSERAGHYLNPHAGWTNTGHMLLNPQSLIQASNPSQKGESIPRHDRRMGFLLNHKNTHADGVSSESTTNVLSDLLERARHDPSILCPKSDQPSPEAALIIADAIGLSALEFRLRQDDEVDCALTLAQMGMDSLKVIELRKWWRRHLNCEVELRELSEEKTLQELGEVATRRIHGNLLRK